MERSESGVFLKWGLIHWIESTSVLVRIPFHVRYILGTHGQTILSYRDLI